MCFKTVLLCFLAFAAAGLGAFDRNKSAQELESIELKVPGAVEKRSYDIATNTSYAVSALVSASHDNIAWFEVRLYENGKQSGFFRSMRGVQKAENLAVVFNSGKATKAEVSFVILQDAMPQSSAVFKQYRFVKCDNVVIQPWSRRGPSRCRREIKDADVILYPNNGKGAGTTMTNINQIIPGKKMRFSADITAKNPRAAMLVVHCSGKDVKSKVFRSKYNTKNSEQLYVDFETENFTWIGIELRCTNGKPFRGKPVIFSNIQVVPVL